MKVIILRVFILTYMCLTLGCLSKKTKSDETKKIDDRNLQRIISITRIDFKSYYNKPIDSLLSNKLLQQYTHKRFVTEPYGCLWNFKLVYSSKDVLLSVNIYPHDSLVHLKRCIDFPKEVWNMDLFRSEKLLKVSLDTIMDSEGANPLARGHRCDRVFNN
jgi:hypothetical protein